MLRLVQRLSIIKRESRKKCRTYSTAKEDHIGFIGLGQMGSRMAANLVKKGKKVTGYDISKENLESLTKLGGSAATNIKSLSNCSVVVTMLPSNPHVRQVYLESDEALVKVLKQPALLIDASTIDPNVSKDVHKAAAAAGHKMIDAPVSGGVLGAEAGTLTFMVGGSQEHYETALPILQLMGKNIVYCGGPGNGQVTKVCNNLVLGISMIAVSEAMNLGVKLGMDPKTLAGIFNTSSARCWSSDTYNPVPGVLPNVPSSRGYSGGFGVSLMAKDLSLAVQAANDIKAPLLLGGSAHQVYNLLSNKSYAGKDFSSVYDYLSKNNN
eukprot:TRINITY_DN15516_c0_g1_i1.p1 TRINITY_DN15516_c0_g1~~TRINITY_DN15516_c0_g1_i1.p1  ORF type:complete len:324 (-),score=57.32 TRINITY_DN15516_c0_g1_i1:14-985(-)